jgi:hypothetical protein
VPNRQEAVFLVLRFKSIEKSSLKFALSVQISKYLKMSHKEPEIVKFAFTQFEINENQNKWHAVRRLCKANITTSSFSR